MLEAPIKTKEERDKKINEINTLITSLSKMTIVDYLQHMKKGRRNLNKKNQEKILTMIQLLVKLLILLPIH